MSSLRSKKSRLIDLFAYKPMYFALCILLLISSVLIFTAYQNKVWAEVYTVEPSYESIKSLKLEKVCLTAEYFIIEIRSSSTIEYETMHIEANAENQHRFLVDIFNSKDRIKLNNPYVSINYLVPSKDSYEPIPLWKLLELPSFPISKLVTAQNSLTPPVTRVVFHLRQKIEPIVETDNEILRVKISIGQWDNGTMGRWESEEAGKWENEKVRERDNGAMVSKFESLELRVDDEKSYLSTLNSQLSTPSPRPAIIESIKPIFLPKTTKLEMISDGQLRIKQARISKGGILRIDIYSATTSLPRTVPIDKGILKNATFEEAAGDLSIYVNLTEPVIYELESTEKGVIIAFQNPLLEQLVSINVNNEPMSSVLMMLFTQYGANIVAGSKITGNVTARLVDVPLKSALDEILKAEGYGYVEDNGLIRVLTSDELKTKDENKVEAQKAAQAQNEVESKVFNLVYAKAQEAQQLMQKMIGNECDVLTDQRTNSLILVSSTSKDRFQKHTQKVEELLKQLDVETPEGKTAKEQEAQNPQAKNIEIPEEPEIVKQIFKLHYIDPDKAKTIFTPLLSNRGMLEAVLMKREKEGGGSGEGSSSSGTAGSGGTSTSDMRLDEAVGQGGYIVISDIKEVVEKIGNEIIRLDVPTPQVEIEAFIVEGSLSDDNELGVDWAGISKSDELMLSFSGDQGLVITKGIIPIEKFTGILNVLANNSKLKVISNPTITTLEGQPAMFHSGDRIPYNKIFIQDGIQQVDTVFEEVGILLAATPYVKDKEMVSMVLSTSVSSESGFTPTGQPRISTRTTRSQVLVKSGDTVVIAGLNSEKDSNTVSKVPIIGDIPIIGKVFSTESKVKQKSEVTIFITPRIVISNQ